MPPKKQIIIIGVLCVVALGLGYWSGPFKKDSGQRAEAIAPTIITNVVMNTPTIITNVVTNVLREVVTNIVTVQPQPTPAPVKAQPAPPPVQPRPQPTPANSVPANTMNPALENAIRKSIFKPTGELTKSDLEKVTYLRLEYNQLTDVKGLEKLTKLKKLYLTGNFDLTKAQVDELKKALPKCGIVSNPKK